MNEQLTIQAKRFVRYMLRTYMYKFYAIVMLMIGTLVMHISGNATCLILMAMFGVPLFLYDDGTY